MPRHLISDAREWINEIPTLGDRGTCGHPEETGKTDFRGRRCAIPGEATSLSLLGRAKCGHPEETGKTAEKSGLGG
jgi:hypothetical protein